MTKRLISEKYLHDIANAIRVKLDSQSTYTPAQMAAAIADITDTISGTITPSTDADKVLVSESNLTAIANAIRAKLDVETQYTPAQMAAAILSIVPVGPSIVSWASGTDAEIGAMIDAAHAGTIDLQQDGGWAVGDVRTIHIDAFTGGDNVAHAGQDIDIVITSFDEYNNSGNLMQFDFKDSLAEYDYINSTNTNVGGYGSSVMKTTTLPALVNAMPSWIKSRLIEFSVLASAGNRSATIETVTGNKLALRSNIEVFNSDGSGMPGEGSYISYYDGTNARKKKAGHSGSNDRWWLRSPTKNNNSSFCLCRVSYTGSPDSTAAHDTSCYTAPFGCL